MRHPNARWEKFCFLVRNQRKSKWGYVKNVVKEHGLNFNYMVDKEWDSYIQYLTDRENELQAN